MNKLVLASVALGVFAVLLSIASALIWPLSKDVPEQDAPPEATETPPEAAATPTPRVPTLDFGDARAVIRVLDGEETREMTMYDYLVGTVAAEMPAAFAPEALRAQATAARTFVIYNMLIAPVARHPDADVCTDITCCAAWIGGEELRDRWGEEFDANLNKIRDAVEATDGIYITYGGEPILAAFHSSSFGRTEDAQSVWESAKPYLVSAPSPETAEDVPNLVSTVTVSLSDFRKTVSAALPEAKLDGDAAAWISDVALDGAGRLASLKIGGAQMSGTRLRAMFELRSTALTVTVTVTEDVVFTTLGYGHGVGMSQYGANVLAKNGADWREILRAYYTGAGFSDENFENTEKTEKLSLIFP
ncbi:MAG: stage II sporulation protein D [Oscillospiraceae bacterium]|jgi:stage II sporulation protein D|nr:stage II sporulation protein D [Oscillospiraceae bacterium]